MRHPDQETLVAFAMGEDVDDAVPTHLDDCADCRGEVSASAHVLHAAYDLGRDPLALELPPDEVWAAIADELDRERRTVYPIPVYVTEEADAPARRRVSARTLVATAGGFLVGAAAVLLGVLLLGRTPEPALSDSPEPVASGPLLPLSGQRANGSARVYDRDGQRTVEVQLRDAEVGSKAYVQAWLLEPGTANMVPLGIVDRSRQNFAVPDGLDLDVYSDVDISREPFDGDPAHSSDSLARAELTP